MHSIIFGEDRNEVREIYDFNIKKCKEMGKIEMKCGKFQFFFHEKKKQCKEIGRAQEYV